MTSDGKTANGPGYAITVRFTLREGTQEKFLALIRENAAASVRDEPGCLIFDVLVPLGDAGEPQVLLYEVYRDRAALDHHAATAHFKAFDEASRDLVTRKEVLEFSCFEHRK